MSVAFNILTLGCAKNEVDSDRMRSLLLQAGLIEVSEPNDADVILVNTCSFLEAATKSSIELILDVAHKSTNQEEFHVPVIVCGCMPSRYNPEELKELLPEVACFVGCKDEDSIVSIVSDVLRIDLQTYFNPSYNVNRTVEGASAYIKISDGCNRFCSFCAIPYIRGRYFSRPMEEILSEAQALLEGGVKELVLIGQDTGIWGFDFKNPLTLSDLLKETAKLCEPYGAWLRVLYLQPEGMTQELIDTIKNTPQVLNYIDIPVQHCNSDILKAMNRRGSYEEYTKLFDLLRQQIPDMVLRTTALVGFPGETQEQFDELCRFISEQQFDYCSVFAYSPEEGTRAAKLPCQISDSIKLEREQVMRDIVEEIGFSANASHVGEEVDVVIDGVEQTDYGVEFIGHAWFQAPDCDGAVHIAQGDFAVGDVVRVKITDAFCYELVGEVVN